MSTRKDYYEYPTQVKLVDVWSEEEEVIYLGAIAYHDVFICGCCGCTFPIDEYYEDWEEIKSGELFKGVENPVKEFKTWVDISAEIAEE